MSANAPDDAPHNAALNTAPNTVAEAAVTAFVVRPATAADIPAIRTIYAHYVETSTATFEEIAPDEAEMQRRLADTLARDLPYLVAETADGAIAGFA